MKAVRDALQTFLPEGGLKRGVAILSGGTAMAQLIAFAVSPILTRLYRVEDFGYLQIFSIIIAILIVIAAGRYEMAIPLPEDDETAVNLLVVALCIVLVVCSLTGIALIFAAHIPWIRQYLGNLVPFLWLMPICLAGGACYQVFSFWSLRKKDYALVAKTRLIQVGSRFFLQLAGALIHLGLFGLLLGETVARANGTGSFFRGFRRSLSSNPIRITRDRMWRAATAYSKFSLIFSVSGLFGAVTLAVPTFLLASFFGPTVTGWFALVDRVLNIPLILIGQSLQQVYMSEGAPLVHSDPVALKRLFIKMVKKVYPIPIATCAFLVLFGPSVFVFVFGPQWREAGEFARILGFVDVMAMLSAPVEMTLVMLRLQNWRFAVDGGRLVLVTVAMLVTHHIASGARAVIMAYAASLMVSFAAVLAISYIGINQLVARTRENGPLSDFPLD